MTHPEFLRGDFNGEPLGSVAMVRQSMVVTRVVDTVEAPCFSAAGLVSETIQNGGDCLVAADFGELFDEFQRRLFGVLCLLACCVARHLHLGVDTALPVQHQQMVEPLLIVTNHDFFHHRSQDALLQLDRSCGIVPQCRQVPPQCQQLALLVFAQLRTLIVPLRTLLFEFREAFHRHVPAHFQLAGHQAIGGIDQVILTPGTIHLVARFLQS